MENFFFLCPEDGNREFIADNKFPIAISSTDVVLVGRPPTGPQPQAAQPSIIVATATYPQPVHSSSTHTVRRPVARAQLPTCADDACQARGRPDPTPQGRAAEDRNRPLTRARHGVSEAGRPIVRRPRDRGGPQRQSVACAYAVPTEQQH